MEITEEFLQDIRTRLAKELSPPRFAHTLGVAYTAASLAMRYNDDVQRALLAGLLHDCGKSIPTTAQVMNCDTRGIALTPEERANPQLAHAKLGAYMATEKYGVTDETLLDAIRCHTTGKPDMNLLERILYVSDCIEPSRHKGDYLTEARRLAFLDLNACLEYLLEKGLLYLKTTNAVVDPMTEATYLYYKNHKEEMNGTV